MNTEPSNHQAQLVEIAKAVGAIVGVPLALFVLVNNIVEQPIISLVVALITAVLATDWVVQFGWTGIMEVVVAWLALAVIVLAGFAVWPRAMTVEGTISDTAGNPVSHEVIVLFDRSGRRYETRTNDEGYYRFTDVPTGKYMVRVRESEVEGETKGILVGVVQQNLTVPETLAAASPTPTPIPKRTATATRFASPTPSATPTPLPTVAIEAEWPKKMEIDRSDWIRVSLVRIAGHGFVPTVETAGHTAVIATVGPVGTPIAPIEKAFGPQYEAFAIAYVAGAAFDVEPLGANYRSLDQPQINWEWNIVPKKAGQQVINVSIEVQWKPVGSDEAIVQIIQRQIWREQLDVLVAEPFIATGQLNLGVLILGFLGTGCSIPWLFDRANEIRKKRQKDNESNRYLPD